MYLHELNIITFEEIAVLKEIMIKSAEPIVEITAKMIPASTAGSPTPLESSPATPSPPITLRVASIKPETPLHHHVKSIPNAENNLRLHPSSSIKVESVNLNRKDPWMPQNTMTDAINENIGLARAQPTLTLNNGLPTEVKVMLDYQILEHPWLNELVVQPPETDQ